MVTRNYLLIAVISRKRVLGGKTTLTTGGKATHEVSTDLLCKGKFLKLLRVELRDKIGFYRAVLPIRSLPGVGETSQGWSEDVAAVLSTE